MTVSHVVKGIQNIMRKDVGVDGDAQRISQMCWMFFLKIIDDQDMSLEATRPGFRSSMPKNFRWSDWAADPEGITGEELLRFVDDELFPKLKNLSAGNDARRRIVREVFGDAYNYMKSGQLMRQVINKIQAVDFNKLAERQHFGEIYEQILNDLQSAGNAGEYYTPRALTAFMVERIDPKPKETLLDPACGTGGFLTCAIRHMSEQHIKRPAQRKTMEGNLRAIEKKPLPHMLCMTNMLLHNVESPDFVRHDNALARPYASYGNADRVDIVLTNPPFGGEEETGVENNFPQEFKTRETADLFLAMIMRLLKPGGRCGIVLPDATLYGGGVKTRIKEKLLKECNLHTIIRLPDSVFSPYADVGTNLLFFIKGEETNNIWYYEHRVPADQKKYSKTRPILLEHLESCAKWWNNQRKTENAWRVGIEEIKARNYNLDFRNPNMREALENPQDALKSLLSSEREVVKLREQLLKILSEPFA